MEILDYKFGDELKILDLFELVFKKRITYDYWKWRFLDNPLNIILIKLMWDKEMLVGHYAVSPIHLNYKNKILISGLSMTTMVHPNYNGLGIFPQLANSLYKELTNKNINLVWGFPNPNSHKTFIKYLGWNNISLIPILSFELDKSTPKFNISIKKIMKFEHKHSNRYQELFQNYNFSINKNIDYLNWRYTLCPTTKYIILEIDDYTGSFIVCKEYTNNNNTKQIDIVEWCVEEDFKLTNSIINHLSYIFSRSIYNFLNIWLPLNNIRHIHFEQIGFINTLPLTYFCVKHNDEEILQERSCWIQLGDSDVY